MAEITRESLARFFAPLPEPDLDQHQRPDSGIPQCKLAIWRALRGVPQDGGYGWVTHYAAGPDQKTKPTPNQHILGLGGRGLQEGLETVDASVDRWYGWMEQAHQGKTYKPAEFMGAGYVEIYVLGSLAVYLAARRDGSAEIADRALRDLRRHAALNSLMRIPEASPPRSQSIGARTDGGNTTVTSMFACALARLPREQWGTLHGADLGQAVSRVPYMGIDLLHRCLEGGLIELPRLTTNAEMVAEVRALDLRAPWPLAWTGDEDRYQAALGPPFPESPHAEAKGGLADAVWATGSSFGPGTRPTVGLPWVLEIGPSGLTVHRQPGGTTIPEPPPPEPEPPAEPGPEEPEPSEPEPSQPTPEYLFLAEARTKAEELHGKLSRRGEKRLALEIRVALRQHAIRELGLPDGLDRKEDGRGGVSGT